MSLSNCFPDPIAFFDNEYKTLRFINRYGRYFKKYPSLISECQIVSDQHARFNEMKISTRKQFLKKHVHDFKFIASFDDIVETKSMKIWVGANYTTKRKFYNQFEEFSYFMAITREEKGVPVVLRKFHFDFDASDCDIIPTFHLQYGGELCKKMDDINCNQERVCPWLSKPRLSFFPVSLAIILHIVFCEFCESDEAKELTERLEWRNLLRANEKLILAEYYKQCDSYANSKDNKKLVFDLFYGK